jgi:toxin-antitoxin system PIN domain toxin
VRAALPDINVLLALAWPNHQHHSQAQAWSGGNASEGWATCALTELGFIRLSSNPAFSSNAESARNAANLLSAWTRHEAHLFLHSPPAADPSIYGSVLGHKQVNDAWLAEVARKNNGCLVTLDRRAAAHAGEDGLVEVIES